MLNYKRQSSDWSSTPLLSGLTAVLFLLAAVFSAQAQTAGSDKGAGWETNTVQKPADGKSNKKAAPAKKVTQNKKAAPAKAKGVKPELENRAIAKTAKDLGPEAKVWVKICEGPIKEGCIVRATQIEHELLTVFGSVTLELPKDKSKKKSLVVTLPYAVLTPREVEDKKTKEKKTVPASVNTTWNLAANVKAKIDENDTFDMKYIYCYRIGCVAQTELTDDLLAKLKKGKALVVAGQNINQPVPIVVSLGGFADAFDGKPVDNNKYTQFWNVQAARLKARQYAQLKAYEKKITEARAEAEKKNSKEKKK